MIAYIILIIVGALCWGSFLNMVAYRLMGGISFKQPRSQCTTCATPLAWYDLIPVLSWLVLSGACRYCKQPISILYPLIELLTVLTFSIVLALVPHQYLFSSLFFTSALLITFRTDLEHMLISRFASIYLIPIFFIISWLGYAPVGIYESALGSITAYACLYMVRAVHTYLTGKVGMGQGDLELLAMIGSFLGVSGWWLTLLIGSLLGSIVGIAVSLQQKTTNLKIPFGPFLVTGAFIALTILTHPTWYHWLLHIGR